MKIGILTFQFADNYGAVIQAYALKKYLEADSENEVEIINYVNNRLKDAYEINPFKIKNRGMRSFVKSCLRYPKKQKQYKLFEIFRKKYLALSTDEVDMINTSKYDIVVVGSDQVWNLKITFGDLNYFLTDVHERDSCIKVSYAASADDEFEKNSAVKKIIFALKEFSAISVREEQLQLKLNNEFGITSSLVADPVFLHDIEFWSTFGIMPKMEVDHYILYYVLTSNCVLEKQVLELSREKRIPIVVVHPMVTHISKCGNLRNDVGPREFIGLIANADFIVTNSFHAFSFSLIFSKKIIFECLEGTSNRISSLLRIMNIDETKVCDGLSYVEMRRYSSKEYNTYVADSRDFIRRNIFIGR